MSLPVAGGKRKRFSFAEKYEILQELDKGAKRTFVQEKYGVAHGTLAGFIKNFSDISTCSDMYVHCPPCKCSLFSSSHETSKQKQRYYAQNSLWIILMCILGLRSQDRI